jgi:predicted XRE-type DNA-binding protein
MTTKQQEKDWAIKTLNSHKNPMISTFMGVEINEFTKDELINILSMQNKMWLESIGFKFDYTTKEYTK